jgi:hypothetical protein
LSRTRSSYLGAYRLPCRRHQAGGVGDDDELNPVAGSFGLTQAILSGQHGGVSLSHPGAWRVVVASALLAPLSALVGAAVQRRDV